MARVNLTSLWMNDAEDPSDFCELPLWATADRSDKRNVDFMPLSDGSLRAITRPGGTVTWAVAIEVCDADTLAWLRSHATKPVYVRDPDGNKIVGVYPQIDDSHLKMPGQRSSVSLTVTQIGWG